MQNTNNLYNALLMTKNWFEHHFNNEDNGQDYFDIGQVEAALFEHDFTKWINGHGVVKCPFVCHSDGRTWTNNETGTDCNTNQVEEYFKTNVMQSIH